MVLRRSSRSVDASRGAAASAAAGALERPRAGTTRRPHPCRSRAPRRQHGAVAMLAAIFLIATITALGALDIGNVFFARRSLQRTADLAALAAVQVISQPSGCAGAQANALQNAAANGFAPDNQTTFLTPTCGRWDTSTSPAFSTTGTPLNAMQVQVSQIVPYLFVGPPRTVTATGTAQSLNIDSYSLSTGIATINSQQSALLNAILGGLLHTSLTLGVADFQSLAGARIKLGDLAVALGASSIQGLLNTTVSYHDLMVGMVKALQAGGDSVDAAILQALEVTVPGAQNITIGDNGTSAPGLLSLALANPDSAANATIDALDAVMVAAQIAQRGTAQNPAPVINVAAGLTGVLGLSLQVINPPALAVGEAITTGTGNQTVYKTMARTAAVNAVITLAPVPLPPLTVGLKGVLSASISALSTPLVVTLAVAPGSAGLSAVDCEPTVQATNATIQVQPGIAGACLTGGSTACASQSAVYASPINLATVTASVVGLTATVANVIVHGIGPLQMQAASQPVTVYGTASGFDVYSNTVNSNQLGSSLSLFSSQLLGAIPGALDISLLNHLIDISTLLSPITTAVGNALTPLLQGVFGLLDTVLVPTLALLGVQVGTATVHNLSLQCGVSQLVN